MLQKKGDLHRALPTEHSLLAFSQDPSTLLECSECGAWVHFDKREPDGPLLESHINRRPEPRRNRMPTRFKGYGMNN